MEILYLLVPISLLLMAIAVLTFLAMINNDQFEDLDCPAFQILFDEDRGGVATMLPDDSLIQIKIPSSLPD
jgi:cbb3-type cytochrome oxidase maturation protein